MTINFHTAIATGAGANAATVEAPLAALDSAITNLLAGSQAYTQINFGAPTTLTLATDTVTITRTRHLIDTEAAAASDNLSTINGGADGDLLMIQSVNAARVVTVKHNVGNIMLAHEADVVLYDPKKVVSLVFDATSTKWVEAESCDLAFRTTINSTLVPARKIRMPDGTIASLGNDEVEVKVMPRPDVRSHFMYRASNTTMKGIGTADGSLAAGTPTASNQADSNYINFATGAVSGNQSGFGMGAPYIDVRPAYAPAFSCLLRTGLAADITAVRIFVVLTAAAVGNVDTLGSSGVGFRFSTVAGDTNWMGVTNNAGVQSVISTGVAVAASTVYLLRMRFDPGGLIAYFSVNGSTEVTLNTNLPPNATDLGTFVSIVTQAASAKNLLVSRFYCDHN